MDEPTLREWQQQVLLPAIRPEMPLPPDESPLPGGGLALFSADTDRTQQFVFQSSRLPEIRGASMRLDDLNRRGLPRVLAQHHLSVNPITHPDKPGCLIYCGGGSLLALIPLDLAETLVQAIERLYPRTTDTATITAVYRPITIAAARGLLPAALQAEALRQRQATLSPEMRARLADSASLTAVQRLMRQQGLALQYRKKAKATLPHVETDPHARLCQSCGRRPAISILSGIPDEQPRYLCSVCHQNDRHGRNNKSAWNERFVTWVWEKHGVSLEAPTANDLQTIGQHSRRYIGYIYADGNSIGKLLERAGSLAEYSRISQKLAEATETAVYAALYDHLHQDGDVLPFEIITIGGDDVLLIVPAHAALPIARDICAYFGAEMAAPSGESGGPSMSAGVAIAQESNPITFSHDLAGQLLKSAKKATQKRGGAHLDFMVLKSQSTLAANLTDVRQSPYLCVEQELTKERCLLTARPYALAEMDRLLQNAQALRQIHFAPGQLHQMRREFQNGRFPALFFYLYQRARYSQDHARLLRDIEATWGMIEPQGAPPWIALPELAADGYREFTTPWLDILELREFVA